MTKIIVERLTLSAIENFLDLQGEVVQYLKRRQKEEHLKCRTYEDLQEHILAGMPMLGVKSPSGEHVAQCLVSYPDYPEAIHIQEFPLPENKSTAIIQAFVVKSGHPQSGYLSSELFEAVRNIAKEEGRSCIAMRVAASNKGVIRQMEIKNKFEIYARAKDPYTNRNAVFMQQHLDLG